jgi:hypothetical protein
MAIKTFTTGEVLTASDTNTYLNNAGLVLITSGITVSSAGGTAATIANGTVTIGTSNTSVTVSGAFSATYDNYRILISSVDCSVSDELFRISLNNSTGSTYVYSTRWNNYSTGAFGGNNSGGTTFWVLGLTSTTDNINYQVEVQSPNLTKRTAFTTLGSSDSNYNFGGGQDTNAVAQTGFVISPASGNLTGGTIRVYGYRQP